MKKQVVIKFLYVLIGALIALWVMLGVNVFNAYDVGQSLFEREYIWPC